MKIVVIKKNLLMVIIFLKKGECINGKLFLIHNSFNQKNQTSKLQEF